MSIQDMKTNDEILIEYLKAEIKELKEELSNWLVEDKLFEENKELKAEIKELKHELKHKAIKIHQDRIPREYKAEAEEYFHHVPEGKEVYFFMLSEWEMKDGESGDLMIDKDNAICVINNEREMK
tara:strand:- start:34 stop:408 length:375 start_codon:yes stop_codon:yes gene_type:complete